MCRAAQGFRGFGFPFLLHVQQYLDCLFSGVQYLLLFLWVAAEGRGGGCLPQAGWVAFVPAGKVGDRCVSCQPFLAWFGTLALFACL